MEHGIKAGTVGVYPAGIHKQFSCRRYPENNHFNHEKSNSEFFGIAFIVMDVELGKRKRRKG